MQTLSVRPAWAWAIMFGGKDIENRSWPTKHRGQLLIHASTNMTSADDDADEIMRIDPKLDVPLILETGAIMGVVDVVDCVQGHRSKWAYPDQWHWVLRNARPLAPFDTKGKLGIWQFPDTLIPAGWMIRK